MGVGFIETVPPTYSRIALYVEKAVLFHCFKEIFQQVLSSLELQKILAVTW